MLQETSMLHTLEAVGSMCDVALVDSPSVTLGALWQTPESEAQLASVVWLALLLVAKTRCVHLKALFFVVVKNERNNVGIVVL
jgi:hypothetical protein